MEPQYPHHVVNQKMQLGRASQNYSTIMPKILTLIIVQYQAKRLLTKTQSFKTNNAVILTLTRRKFRRFRADCLNMTTM